MSAAHEALGVPVGATAADIRRAYRRLSRTHHPDMLPPGASDAERKAAAERFNIINRAYEKLSPEKQQQREHQEQERRQQKQQQQRQESERQQRARQDSERQRQDSERQQRARQDSERQRQDSERQQRERQQQERQRQDSERQRARQGQERQGATGPAGFIPLWVRERLGHAALNVGEVVAQQGEAVVRDLGHTGVDKGVDFLRSLFRAKP